MKNYLIIIGHGNYASGILSALQLIEGPKEEIIAFDFLKEESEEEFANKLQKKLPKDGKYLFACDLLGGTPYKVASRLKTQNENIAIVTGANVGGLLDISFKLDTFPLEQLVNFLKEASLKNLIIVSDLKVKEEEVTDGI